MDNIVLLKHMVRLSQISEEVEEYNPRASELLDSSIKDFAPDTPVEKPNLDLFPPVKTPVINSESEDIETLARRITHDIQNSPRFKEITRTMSQEDGQKYLQQLVRSEVEETLRTEDDDDYPETLESMAQQIPENEILEYARKHGHKFKNDAHNPYWNPDNSYNQNYDEARDKAYLDERTELAKRMVQERHPNMYY